MRLDLSKMLLTGIVCLFCWSCTDKNESEMKPKQDKQMIQNEKDGEAVVLLNPLTGQPFLACK